jgi:hypothetical protein
MCSDRSKVLMVCKEHYTYPMNFVKDELKALGYDVEALFIHYTETILQDHSYLSFHQRNKDTVAYTFNSAIQTFWNNYKNCERLIDKPYLQYVEKEYCKDLPFGILLMSTQVFTTPYHYRFYFKDLTEGEKLYWVQLVFKEVERTLEISKPDRIVDIDNSELGRSVLCQVAKVKKIPYATLESSRYESIWLPTFNLGRETDQYFINKYTEIFDSQNIQNKYMKMANDFRDQEKIMLPDYKFNSTAKRNSAPFLKDAAKLLLIIKFLIVYWCKNPRLVGLFRRRPMIASLFHPMKFFILWFVRERYLLSRRSRYFENIDTSDTYIYFPLHMIPESTTLIKSPFYPNEIAVIEAVSKSLPMGWKLYVKEHGSMVGERPIKFYKSIKRLTNVRLVRLDAHDDPKPWIQNSVGVITLSGSSAFEAAMMGKPSLIFGNTLFELIKGIEKVSSFAELPKKIISMKDKLSDNTKSCAAYLQAIHELGKYIPLTELMVKSQSAMFKNEPLPKDLSAVITDLVEILLREVNNVGCKTCAV